MRLLKCLLYLIWLHRHCLAISLEYSDIASPSTISCLFPFKSMLCQKSSHYKEKKHKNYNWKYNLNLLENIYLFMLLAERVDVSLYAEGVNAVTPQHIFVVLVFFLSFSFFLHLFALIVYQFASSEKKKENTTSRISSGTWLSKNSPHSAITFNCLPRQTNISSVVRFVSQ